MSNKKSYPQIEEGQAVDIDWRRKDYKIACCDCGLVHRFRFAAIGHRLRIRAWRDNRATSAIRRHGKNLRLVNGLQTKAKHKDIIEFISGFNCFENNDVLRNTFTRGYCYYFCVILRERFPGGVIVYSPLRGHFLYKIGKRLYDVTGEVKDIDVYYDFSDYPDRLQKERIIRDCILK